MKYVNRSSHITTGGSYASLTAFSAMAMIGALAAAFDAQAADPASPATVVYVAHLHPMNSKIIGSETTAEARFSITGDKLAISIKARGLPPNIVHWQHFHGFVDNRAATCRTAASDSNGDGVIDLIETEAASGTTMVPFTDDPVSMDVAHGTYPKSSASGTYTYLQTVSFKRLTAAFAKAFDDQTLELDRRVVFIHGVLPSTKLPVSVASLGPIPAEITLPIACGTIERIER